MFELDSWSFVAIIGSVGVFIAIALSAVVLVAWVAIIVITIRDFWRQK